MREMFLLEIKAHKLVEASLETRVKWHYLANSVVVLFVWWWVVVCKHETISQGEIVSLQFGKSHPILQGRGKELKQEFWAYKCNTRSYCHYAFKPRRKQSKGTQQRHLFNICFANVFIKRSYFLLRHIFTNFVAKSCYGYKVWRCWAVAILNKLL